MQSDVTLGLVLPPEGCCFHCGDPVPTPPFSAQILGESREMCCLGCQLAAQSIVEAGLEQYYLDRSEISRTAKLPTQLTQLQAYDHEEIRAQFVYVQGKYSVAELSVSNLRCAACTWLIETRLYELSGVQQCQVNLTNQRMRVIWDESERPISEILSTINQIGYEAKPYRQDTHEAMLAKHNKQMLIRLGIAALGAMQAMMFALALYFGEYSGMELLQRDFLRWVSLFVSIPVFFYAGLPFFMSAWAAIKAKQVNMDVPVSIALVVTFFASLYATVTGQGETYYDSVSMFIFFLLAGRFVEHNARLKAATMASDLVVIEPTLVDKIGSDVAAAARIGQKLAKTSGKPSVTESTANDMLVTESGEKEEKDSDNDSSNDNNSDIDIKAYAKSWWQGYQDKGNLNNKAWHEGNGVSDVADVAIMTGMAGISEIDAEPFAAIESITTQSLQVGDVIRIDAGAEVISDGILLSEQATVSQSLLTGESDLLLKQQGDVVIGGSQNDSQPFVMLVTALPKDSQLGLIDRLMNRAMSEKPRLAQQADKLARWFVARVLVLSLVVLVAWYVIEPSQAIWATVAVLVATCPCALSLATPIALTVSTNRLARYGFLTTRGHTLQTLAEITHVAFDKTGTLTYGKPNLLAIEGVSPDRLGSEAVDIKAARLSDRLRDEYLSVAAALEVGSRHPVAHALLTAAYQLHLPKTTDLQHYPAGGVQAVVEDKTYRIGHVAFVQDMDAQSSNEDKPTQYEQNHYEQNKDKQNIAQPDLKTHRASSVVALSQKMGASGWQVLAYFYFNDTVREDAKALLDGLKAQGLKTVMLTGDPSSQALEVAESLGIETAYHGLSPNDKVTHLRTLQEQGGVVLMVGDGINDAPVLAAADVSTSIAGAADLAQVSSDSVILNGRIAGIADAKRIADKTERIIKQNFKWAVLYNGLVLLPAALGYVPPWLAAIGMSLSSLLVVLNAMRLKRA